MVVKLVIIIGFSYLYAFFEVFLNLRQRKKSAVSAAGDKGSLWLLYGLITLGYALCFAAGARTFGRMPNWDAFFAVGAAWALLGLGIRVYSLRALGPFFTYSVAKVQDHQLVETGLYRYIRHPGYLGQLLIFFGIALSLSNWVSVLLMLLPVICGYWYRIRVEERFMQEQMGETYRAYQQRTARLFPGVY